MPTCVADMPLSTYPEPVTDSAVLAVARLAAAFGFELHVSAFSVRCSTCALAAAGRIASRCPGTCSSRRRKEQGRVLALKGLLEGPTELHGRIYYTTRQVVMGAAFDAAAIEARYYDVSVLPWSDETVLTQDMAEAVVFGSGRPT